MENKPQNYLQTATFAAGCFWQVEETFRKVKGVKDVTAGYTGGTMPKPTYEKVCSGATGHAEAVNVVFDPKEVGYEELLKIFWENHDPTTPNRQGPDIGTQYRSAVFYHDARQEKAAKKMKGELEKSGRYKNPIVTEIAPLSEFYRAEEYHQRYLAKARSEA